VHFCPHLCTPGKTFRSVTHPEIAPGQACLTSEFFTGGFPKKKVYLGGMSILSIMLSLESGCHKNRFVPRRFRYNPRPDHGDRFSRMSGVPTGGSYTHFEPRHLDDLCFLRRGSRPIRPNGEVKRIMKTSSDRMVRCWILKIYLTNPSTEPLTPSRPM
jgi:hypothetical protein